MSIPSNRPPAASEGDLSAWVGGTGTTTPEKSDHKEENNRPPTDPKAPDRDQVGGLSRGHDDEDPPDGELGTR